jgi:hypothetical protein
LGDHRGRRAAAGEPITPSLLGAAALILAGVGLT